MMWWIYLLKFNVLSFFYSPLFLLLLLWIILIIILEADMKYTLSNKSTCFLSGLGRFCSLTSGSTFVLCKCDWVASNLSILSITCKLELPALSCTTVQWKVDAVQLLLQKRARTEADTKTLDQHKDNLTRQQSDGVNFSLRVTGTLVLKFEAR